MMIPIVNTFVENEGEKSLKDFRENLPKAPYPPMRHIPEKGFSKEHVIERLNSYQTEEKTSVSGGKMSGVLFTDRSDILEISEVAAAKFLYTNAIYYNKTAPSRQMENEIITFTKN